jgi:cyclohexa-1,5-dienecarbonyl-CoA hydratase
MGDQELGSVQELGGEQDLDSLYTGPQVEEFKLIEFGMEDGIARITLNRAPANVLSVDMMTELNQALESLEYEREVKLVVFRGAGKYFSAGFELQDHLGDRAYMMLEGFRRVFENLAKVDKPTLAVVAGPALGAGSILAGACDMVLAGAGARFGHPEIKGGVFNTVAAVLLPRIVGHKKAFDMMLGGAAVSAAEAERIGLVTRAVPDEKLEEEAAAVVQRFKEASAPIVQCARRALVRAGDLPFAEAIRETEDVYLNTLMGSEDLAEGLKAIMEKRKPVWKNR